MIRYAFTLVELIFVIIIIGILAGVASSAYRPDYLDSDIDFIASKIKQAQYRGIGYEHRNFDGSFIPDEIGCIVIEKSAMEEDAADGASHYRLRVDAFDEGMICFDAKGRPHQTIAGSPDFSDGTLLTVKKDIALSYAGETKNVTILPLTGYVLKSCN